MRLRNRSIVSGVLLIVLLLAGRAPDHLSGPCSAVDAAETATADFYVSPKGNDTWSGRLAEPGHNDGPFATVARAQQAVRALLATQKKPVRVVLRAGTYYLDKTLEFGPEDSGTQQAPVVYAAAAGEKVVLSGGRRLEGGHWGEANGQKAWVVDIPEVKEGQWRFRQLFVNGVRCPRTRLPKQGEYTIESLPGYTGEFARSPTKKFVYAPGNIEPTWRNLRDVDVIGICFWLDNRLPIESVDGKTRTVTFDRPSLFALINRVTNKPGTYWVENVFEALDTAGQWYLDRPSGQLYYLPRPGEDPAVAEIVAPRLLRVVQVAGRPSGTGSASGTTAHDIRFEGLTFSHTEWQPPADYASSLQAGIDVPGAVLFDYAERCAVTGGGIEHIGNYGVEVGVGCADIEISRNQITDIGAGGIRIGHFFSWEEDGHGYTERGLKRKASMPKGPHSQRITVADNEIAHCGRFTPEAVGIFVGDNANNQVVHNHVYDMLYSGISVGSFQNQEYPEPSQAKNNVVEHNYVHDICQGMFLDVGGIYTCSSPASRIRYNIIHDVAQRDGGGCGIAHDEGSCDMLIEKNLVYRCENAWGFSYRSRGFTVENNIFAYGTKSRLWGYSGDYPHQFTFRHNLVYYTEGIVGPSFARSQSEFDYNLYYKTGGSPVMFGNKNFAQWQATGQDKHSVVADPLFVDQEHGDFRLKPGSSAEKIGFQPWDLSDVGPRPMASE